MRFLEAFKDIKMHDMIKQPAHKIVELIKTKVISSEEVTKAFLHRIQEVNPALNAVIQLDEEESLHLAKKADLAIAQGKTLGPLHGLPITVKDTIDIRGYNNTYGSHLYDDYNLMWCLLQQRY